MLPMVKEGTNAIAAALATDRLNQSMWDRFRYRTGSASMVDSTYARHWDFDTWGSQTAALTAIDGFKAFLDTGNVVTQLTTDPYGVVQLATAATDNNANSFSACGDVGTVQITSGGTKAVAFDMRVRFTQVTNTYDFFAGLTAAGSATHSGMIADDGSVADRACMGFRVTETAGSALEFIFKKAGPTVQTTTGLKVVAAATWYRLGALFDPSEPDPTHRVKIYIEDAIVGYLTDTQLAAATFPSAVLQTFGFGIKSQAAAAKSWDIDCAAIAMAA
jgi:hypothetical protein